MSIRTRTQIRPLGTDAATDHLIAQMQRLMDELQIFESEDIAVKSCTRGSRLYIKRKTPPGTFAFPWQTPNKELDPSVSVASGTFVLISQNNPIATAGLVDLVSNVLTQASPGIWQAMQDVPPETTTGTGSSAVTKYNVPQPLVAGAVTGSPLSGDADNPALFWLQWPPTGSCY